MTSETLFLQPIIPNPGDPNFAKATGSATFENYSQTPSGSLTAAEVDVLVKGGVASAIADAQATFFNDPTFTSLFTSSSGVGEEGVFEVTSSSETQVIASFSVAAKQTFSFDFFANLGLKAKEIEDPNREYSHAESRTAFLILDTSDISDVTVYDYFGFFGDLISSKQLGDVDVGSSDNIKMDFQETADIDGNNYIDSVTGTATGTYQRTFTEDTRLSLVQINTSAIHLLGDTFIGTLGKDVTYGSIWDDKLYGTEYADKIYVSTGNDIVSGRYGDDVIEGGRGDDQLYGDGGKDKIHGGFGDDTIYGGEDADYIHGGDGNDVLYGGTNKDIINWGDDDDWLDDDWDDWGDDDDDNILRMGRRNDVIIGGKGYDTFVLRPQDLPRGEYDAIQDFTIGEDKVEFRGWGNINASYWFSQVVSQGWFANTQEGALLTTKTGGQILFEGLDVSSFSGNEFTFV
ncbi:MAG: hypothetical protein QNJ47_04375 [Nostocaceae cyanobacterium]|nr:hypothetical protein [Nostocaceae cyanobacterium]